MEKKSTLFKILSIFEELYPGWVAGLKKDQVKKRSVCGGYKRVLTPEITDDHLTLLEIYLKSALNTDYRKWPPPPLELLKIFDMTKKKPQSVPNTFPLPILCSIDLQKNVSYWVASVLMGKRTLDQVPTNLRHYLEIYFGWRTHPDIGKFAKFYLLFKELIDKINNLTMWQIFEKMLSPEKGAWLEEKIGKIDRAELIQYLIETRIDEEIYQYLVNKGTIS